MRTNLLKSSKEIQHNQCANQTNDTLLREYRHGVACWSFAGRLQVNSLMTHVLRYAATLLLLLCLGVENAWAVDPPTATFTVTPTLSSGTTYEITGLDIKGTANCTWVEVPSSTAYGYISFSNSSGNSRNYYIYGTNGTAKDASRYVVMYNGYYAPEVLFTPNDILTSGGKYYVVFKADAGIDFKATKVKFTLFTPTNISTSTFYPLYASSSKTAAQLITAAAFPSYVSTDAFPTCRATTISAINSATGCSSSVSSPHNFSSISSSTSYYRLTTGSNKIILNALSNVKSIRLYGNGRGNTRSVTTTVSKISGTGNTFTVSDMSMSNSGNTIVEYTTGDLTQKSGYNSTTYYTYTITFPGNCDIWGIYVEAGAATGCSDWGFYYGTDGQSDWNHECFTYTGASNEWQITDFVIPNKPNWYVDNAAGNDAKKVLSAWSGLYFAATQGDGARPMVGAATGAVGTIRIYDNSSWNNRYAGFIPDGYVLKFGSSEYPFTLLSSNEYRSEIVEYNSTTADDAVSVGIADGNGDYVASNNTQTMRHIFLNTGGTDLWSKDDVSNFGVYDVTNGNWTSLLVLVPGESYLYEAWVPSTCAKVSFHRLKSSTPKWKTSDGDATNTNIYNSTGDQTLSSDKSLFTITDWGTGTWSTYEKKGKFRMNADYTDKNWYVRFYPYYVLTYDKNNAGASGTMSEQSVACDAVSKSVTVAANGFTAPTGYTFNTWKTGPSSGTSYAPEASYTLSADATLYAQWSPKTCTVTFDKNGGSGTITDVTATYDAAMPSKESNLPTKAGYDFGGFYDDEGCTGTKYYNADGTSAQNWDKNTTSTTTLYAKWTAHTYTVSLELEGGSGTTSISPVYMSDLGTSAIFSAPTLSNYTFGGFYTGRGGTGTQIINKDRKWVKSVDGWTDGTPHWIHTSDETLYAHWYREHTIDKNGGSAGGKVVANYKGTMGTITAPTYSGCTPDGYYAESGCNTLVMAANGTLESNVTNWTSSDRKWIQTGTSKLYAHWKIDAPTISCSKNTVTISTTLAGTTIYYTTNGSDPTTSSSVYSAPFAIAANTTVKAYAVKSSFTDSDPASASCTYETTYTVSYEKNGGSGDAMASVTDLFAGDQVTTSACTYTNSGNKFKWWNTASNGSGEDFYVGEKVTIASADVPLYAQWESVGSGEEFWVGDNFTFSDHVMSVGDMRLKENNVDSNTDITKDYNQVSEYSSTAKKAKVLAMDAANEYMEIYFSDGSAINELKLGTVHNGSSGDKKVVVIYSTTADFSSGSHEEIEVDIPTCQQSSKSVTDFSPSTEDTYTHARIYRSVSSAVYSYTGPSSGGAEKMRIYSIKAKKGIACTAPTSPSISGTTSYTYGETVSLTASASNTDASTTYAWYLGDPDDSGVLKQAASTSGATYSGVLNVAEAGTYYCVIANGTCTAKACKAITIAKASISPSFSYESTTIPNGGTSSTPTVSGNPGSGAVSFAITAADPSGSATVNGSTGVVTGAKVGTATVTMTVAGSDNYLGNTATVNFTIREPILYTVTYNAGASATCKESDTQATEGSSITLATPTWSGYEFQGWFLGASDLGKTSYTPTANVTVYAQWKQTCAGGGSTTVVIFDGSTMSSKTSAETSYTRDTEHTHAGTGLKYTLDNVKDELYTTSMTNNTGNGKSYTGCIRMGGVTGTNNYIEIKVPTGSTADLYIVSGAGGGATDIGVSTTKGSGDTYYELAHKSWSSSGTLDKQEVSDLSAGTYYINAKTDKLVIAELKVTVSGGSCYYVTYDGNGADGGFVNDPTAYDDENNDVTVLANGFTRTGYVFKGWNTEDDGSGDSYAPGATITGIDDDVTLFAIWAEVKTFTDATEDHKWSTGGNWSGATSGAPSIDDYAVITKPATVDCTDAQAWAVVLDQSGDNTGSLEISAGKELVVATTVKKTTDGSSLVATGEGDIFINSNSSNGLGALAMGAHDGTNYATVNYYSKSHGSKGSSASVSQYVGTPFGNHPTMISQFYNSWMYKLIYSDDLGNLAWDRINGDTPLYPFQGYCVISADNEMNPGHMYWMQGQLFASEEQTIELDLRFSKEFEAPLNLGNENMLANSWMAPIKINAFDIDDSDGVTDFDNTEATIYIFNSCSPDEWEEDEKGSGGFASNYSTYTVGSAEETDVIPSMQAFSVFPYGTAGVTTPSIKLNYKRLVYDPAVAGTTPVANKAPRRGRVKSSDANKLRLFVRTESGYGDMLYMWEHEDFSVGFENGWDGHKLFGESVAPQLYAVTSDGNMAVNCVPDYEGVVMGFKAGSNDNIYTFTFECDDAAEALYLYDTETQAYTRVLSTNSYLFTTTDKAAHNRFILTRRIPQTPTGMEVTGDGLQDAGVRKLLINDHIYIIRGGKMYSVDGAIVK